MTKGKRINSNLVECVALKQQSGMDDDEVFDYDEDFI